VTENKRDFLPDMILNLAAALSLGAVALAHAPGDAEIRLEERNGVLDVKNIESAVAAVTATSPVEANVPRRATPYRDLIRAAAARHGLAPELVESVIRVESNFEARAISRKGARGLMQLMPATAARLGVRNVFDVQQNIEGGVRHLRHLVDRYGGNLPLALAAYNAGVGAVARYDGIPPYAETRAYVARILLLLERAGLSVSAEAAEAQAAPQAEGATIETRTLHRYKTADGRVVYSNLPIDKLSVTVREMLEEQ
jgi:soluble lytic murein transglycosylase-like protein